MTSGKRARQQRKAAPKRQHIVPRLYLSAWADQKGRLRLIQKATAKAVLTSVENAAVRSKFYTLFAPDGSEVTVVEDVMAKVEGAAKASLDALRLGQWPLPPEHRDAIANLIALQVGRAPQLRVSLQKGLNEAIEKGRAMKSAMDDLRQNDPERYLRASEFQSRLQSLDDRPGISLTELEEGMWQTPLQILASTAGLVALAAGMNWTLIEAAGGEFETCDQPVVLWPNPAIPQFYGIGLGTAERVTFPVSRSLCLELRMPAETEMSLPPEERENRRLADAQEVTLINSMTTWSADRDVITHPAQQFTDLSPGIELDRP